MIIIEEGEDVALIATGETVQRAFLASQILKENNINPTIVSMHTIKPFDSETFLKIAKKSKVIVSIEEHSEFGGLGEQCASLIAQNQINTNDQCNYVYHSLILISCLVLCFVVNRWLGV